MFDFTIIIDCLIYCILIVELVYFISWFGKIMFG